MRILISLIFLFILIKADDKFPFYLLPSDSVNKKDKIFELVGFKGDMKNDIKFILSTLEEKPLKLDANKIKLPRSFYDNYHVLVANLHDQDESFTATYYIYKHGKPSRTSPTKLTSKQKGIFEIQPNPLPREHDRYFGSKGYKFIVKLDNKPLSNQLINLNTLNGTKQKIFTNNHGEFTLRLPNDFKDVKVGKRANPPSHYILSSSIQKGDRNYHTTFTSPYYVNPNDYWSNIPMGFGVASFGLLIGLFILWRRKNG